MKRKLTEHVLYLDDLYAESITYLHNVYLNIKEYIDFCGPDEFEGFFQKSKNILMNGNKLSQNEGRETFSESTTTPQMQMKIVKMYIIFEWEFMIIPDQ
jgi:hypothetical protein